MSESCETCRFSAPAANAEAGVLLCRRRPPVDSGRRPAAQFPVVYPATWCGEYEAQATKPARAKRPAAGEQEKRGEQS